MTLLVKMIGLSVCAWKMVIKAVEGMISISRLYELILKI